MVTHPHRSIPYDYCAALATYAGTIVTEPPQEDLNLTGMLHNKSCVDLCPNPSGTNFCRPDTPLLRYLQRIGVILLTSPATKAVVYTPFIDLRLQRL
jgi:hypothetical protein